MKKGTKKNSSKSLVEERINKLCEWRKKYPLLPVDYFEPDFIEYYSKSNEETGRIKSDYEEMYKYYIYLRDKRSRGELFEDQISRCKEGDIRGVFGYPTELEDLAKKYGKTENDMSSILDRYGSIDNLYDLFKRKYKSLLLDIDIGGLDGIVAYIVNIDGIGMSGYDRLWKEITDSYKLKDDSTIRFYSSEALQKQMNEKLTDEEKDILNRIYGLNGEASKHYSKVAKEENVSKDKIKQKRNKALSKLKYSELKELCQPFANYEDLIESATDKEKKGIQRIEKDIFLQRGELADNLKKMESELKTISDRNDQRYYKAVREAIISGNLLPYVDQYSREELIEIIGLTQEQVDEAISKAEEQEKLARINSCFTDRDFSTRTYNCLDRAEILTWGELAGKTAKDLLKISGFGKKSLDEVQKKLSEYGLSLKPERKDLDKKGKRPGNRYVQEALDKQQKIKDLQATIEEIKPEGQKLGE